MSELEDRLSSALRRARSDPQWGLTPPGVDLDGVRRAAARRRHRERAAAGTAAVLVLLLAASAAAIAGRDSETLRPASPPATAGVPAAVPSVTPPWRPASARDWVLPHEQYVALLSTHQIQRPTSAPTPVTSPARLTPVTAALSAQVRAGAPSGSTLDRDDAPGGDPEVAAVHVTTPDGAPVEVQQRQMTEPQDERDLPPVAPVPDSDDLYSATASSAGFGFPRQPDGVHAVHVVDGHGRMTTWYAPRSVPLATLTQWALTAARTR